MADMPSGPEVPDVPTVTVVHKVKSKLGYTEIHSTAEGFGENEKVIRIKLWRIEPTNGRFFVMDIFECEGPNLWHTHGSKNLLSCVGQTYFEHIVFLSIC